MSKTKTSKRMMIRMRTKIRMRRIRMARRPVGMRIRRMRMRMGQARMAIRTRRVSKRTRRVKPKSCLLSTCPEENRPPSSSLPPFSAKSPIYPLPLTILSEVCILLPAMASIGDHIPPAMQFNKPLINQVFRKLKSPKSLFSQELS